MEHVLPFAKHLTVGTALSKIIEQIIAYAMFLMLFLPFSLIILTFAF